MKAPAVMVASGLSLYAGAALAIGLFEILPPALVAWLRMSAAGLILVVLHRPGIRDFLGRAGFRAAVFGLVTLGMNMTFYEAIARLPMGTAVAIEFLGPILVAALGSRTIRDWLALALAGVGVVVMSGAQWDGAATGVLFALAAAALWAGYIVVGSKISGDVAVGRTGLAVGFTWSGFLLLPLALWLWPAGGVDQPLQLLGLSLGLGLLSAVIPYSLDQVVLRMAGPAYFAMLLALLPVTAAVLGAVVLGQLLSIAEVIGICAVVAAVALRRP